MLPAPFNPFARLNLPWLDLWFASAQLGLEAQAVIGMRLYGMATGALPAAHEAGLMIPEKMAAFTDAQMLLARAAFAGRSGFAAEDVVRLYRRRGRADHRRLTRAR